MGFLCLFCLIMHLDLIFIFKASSLASRKDKEIVFKAANNLIL